MRTAKIISYFLGVVAGVFLFKFLTQKKPDGLTPVSSNVEASSTR